MKTIFKFAVAAALTGALVLAAATPSEARKGRNAAAGIGFAAGALVGAAIANSQSGYYYDRGYAPGYYVEPGYPYDQGYAYVPAPVYMEPAAPTYYTRPYYSGSSRNRNCSQSPASMNFGQPC
jgi:hypothetical protein